MSDKNIDKIRIVTPFGKISYPSLVEAKALKLPDGTTTETKKFRASLFLKTSDVLKSGLAQQIEDLATRAGFNREVTRNGKSIQSHWHSPLKFKDEIVNKDGKSNIPNNLGFDDACLLAASTGESFPPVVCGADGQRLSDEEVAKIKGGDVVRFQITLQPYSKGTNNGVTAYLSGVQLLRSARPDEALGSGVAFSSAMGDQSASEWDDIPF